MNILDWKKKNNEEESFDIVDEKKKSVGLFEYISFITDYKQDWNSLSDTEKKGFTPFIINKTLAMNPLFACLVADMQKYTMGEMPVETIYYLYHKVLPAKKYYTKYIKSKKEDKYTAELIDLLCIHYKESKKNVIDYLDILNQTEIISILEKYGKDEKEINKILKKPTEKKKIIKKK